MAETSNIGTALTCTVCGSQVIVVKPSGSRFTCCNGSPLMSAGAKERHVGTR